MRRCLCVWIIRVIFVATKVLFRREAVEILKKANHQLWVGAIHKCLYFCALIKLIGWQTTNKIEIQ